MKRLIKTLVVATFFLIAFIPSNVRAQLNFVYSNNNGGVFPFSGDNTVSGFRVGLNGSLVEIPGSPFRTGGRGSAGFLASNNIISVGNFLYVSNNTDSTISGFSIDSNSGIPTPMSGSPFAVGGISWSGISLAVTPDRQFLIAANTHQGSLHVYSIAPDGALQKTSETSVERPQILGIEVTADGKYLALAQSSQISIFRIRPNGKLISVPNSPFSVSGPGSVVQVAANSRGDLLFALKSSNSVTRVFTGVEVFRLNPDGSLNSIGIVPPVQEFGVNTHAMTLSSDDRHLFVSDFSVTRSVAVFNVAEDGTLTVAPGAPFSIGDSTLPPEAVPNGMSVSRDGALLFVAVYRRLIDVFRISSNGALTLAEGSPFSYRSLDIIATPLWLAAVSFPRIIQATVSGKRLVIVGDNFDMGSKILLNGIEQGTLNSPDSPSTLIGKKTGKKIKPGDLLQIINADGTISPQFTYSPAHSAN
jgi:6-phosphogluconolactonase (cycloisomerase 2 family)